MPNQDSMRELVDRARLMEMSPADRRAQRRSLIRGLSGNPELTDEKITKVLPELKD